MSILTAVRCTLKNPVSAEIERVLNGPGSTFSDGSKGREKVFAEGNTRHRHHYENIPWGAGDVEKYGHAYEPPSDEEMKKGGWMFATWREHLICKECGREVILEQRALT